MLSGKRQVAYRYLDLSSDDDFDLTVDDSAQTAGDIGNISAGTSAGALKQLSLSQLITNILFEDVVPSVTNSGSITLSPYNSRKALLVGDTVSQFTATFHPGDWSNGNDYRGDATTGSASLGGTSQSLTYSSNVVTVNLGVSFNTLGSRTLTVTATCLQGSPQLTSLGNSFANNFGPATTLTKTSYVEVVIPVYYGNSGTTIDFIRPWSDWTYQAITLPAGTGQFFEIPVDFTTSPTIQELDPFSGAYVDQTGSYSVTTGISRTFNGLTFSYRKYTASGTRGIRPTRLFS